MNCHKIVQFWYRIAFFLSRARIPCAVCRVQCAPTAAPCAVHRAPCTLIARDFEASKHYCSCSYSRHKISTSHVCSVKPRSFNAAPAPCRGSALRYGAVQPAKCLPRFPSVSEPCRNKALQLERFAKLLGISPMLKHKASRAISIKNINTKYKPYQPCFALIRNCALPATISFKPR